MASEAQIVLNRRNAGKYAGRPVRPAGDSLPHSITPFTCGEGRERTIERAKQSQFPSASLTANLLMKKELGRIPLKVVSAKQSQFLGTGCRAFAGERLSRVEWSLWKSIR
jgi:hypothetical protein